MSRFGTSWFGAVIIVLFLALFTAPMASAQEEQQQEQTPPRPAQPTPLVSPEILPDNRVTFRISAPEANQVIIIGDLLENYQPENLVKDDQGVWSVTLGPLVPDVYSYAFYLDGVKVVDPSNPGVKQGIRSTDSMFLLPGAEADFLDVHPVPHGTISIVWYQSSSLGMMRRMRIYTPPGYDNNRRKRYPAFYLLHGGGDNDLGWSTIGRAGLIIDNLLAEGKAEPMIVVMPDGSVGRSPAAAGAQATGRFEDDMVQDIIPYVEENYRVLARKDQRAIAGLSMGGGQTLRLTLENPDMFSYIGVFSSGARSVDEEFEKGLEELETEGVKLYWIGCGVNDQLAHAGSVTLAGLLEKHGIEYTFRESPGGHTWINWRHYLAEFAPLLFR